MKDGKSRPPTDFNGVAKQFSDLREDVARLSHSVTAIAKRRGRQVGPDISDSVDETIHYVESKGQRAEAGIEKTILTQPLLAFGLAAGFGLVIEAMTQR